MARFLSTLESSVNDVDAVGLWFMHMFFHEASESTEIRRDVRDAHHRALGRCVAPRFVIGREDAQMATTDEFFVIQRDQRTGRAEKLRMEDHFHSIVTRVEQLTPTKSIQDRIGGILADVVRADRRER